MICYLNKTTIQLINIHWINIWIYCNNKHCISLACIYYNLQTNMHSYHCIFNNDITLNMKYNLSAINYPKEEKNRKYKDIIWRRYVWNFRSMKICWKSEECLKIDVEWIYCSTGWSVYGLSILWIFNMTRSLRGPSDWNELM